MWSEEAIQKVYNADLLYSANLTAHVHRELSTIGHTGHYNTVPLAACRNVSVVVGRKKDVSRLSQYLTLQLLSGDQVSAWHCSVVYVQEFCILPYIVMSVYMRILCNYHVCGGIRMHVRLNSFLLSTSLWNPGRGPFQSTWLTSWNTWAAPDSIYKCNLGWNSSSSALCNAHCITNGISLTHIL